MKMVKRNNRIILCLKNVEQYTDTEFPLVTTCRQICTDLSKRCLISVLDCFRKNLASIVLFIKAHQEPWNVVQKMFKNTRACYVRCPPNDTQSQNRDIRLRSNNNRKTDTNVSIFLWQKRNEYISLGGERKLVLFFNLRKWRISFWTESMQKKNFR